MSNGGALLRVRNLVKQFPIKKGFLIERTVDHVNAVDDASFDIHRGKTLGLVGESGSGKSTTGYCVLQVLRPTSGSVVFDDRELTEMSGEELRRMRRRMQLVFQDPHSSLDPRMTVGDIVEEPLAIHKVSTRRERRARVRELLDTVGFDPTFTNRYPHEFSGGHRQRIGIARALALSPDLLVLDEPVSALDVSIQAQILNLLKDLQREFGLTYLFIAHDLATFARYDTRADRWEVLPALPEPTRAAAAASVGSRIYVVGGTTTDGNTTALWANDPGSGAWSRRADLPAPRFNHGAVAYDRRLYVLGGFSEGLERRDVYAYDPTRVRWARVSRLPRPNHAFGVVAYEGELWVIGGRSGETVLREVWILDLATLEWRQGPALPEPMELLGATVAGDEIHAVWESTYQIYDGSTGRWRDGPQPVVTRHALEAFAVDGVLYTVGGCTTALRDSPVVERISIG